MEGIDNKSGKKAVKYSIAFDGILPSHSNVFTNPGYASEDIALPEVARGTRGKEIGIKTSMYWTGACNQPEQ